MKPESHWDAVYERYRQGGLSHFEAARKTDRLRSRDQNGPVWLWLLIIAGFLYLLLRSLA